MTEDERGAWRGDGRGMRFACAYCAFQTNTEEHYADHMRADIHPGYNRPPTLSERETAPDPKPTIRNGDVDEADRRTIIANGIVVDVIANEDGSVYVECYPYESRGSQVIVNHAAIDSYTARHPNFKLGIAHPTTSVERHDGERDRAASLMIAQERSTRETILDAADARDVAFHAWQKERLAMGAPEGTRAAFDRITR